MASSIQRAATLPPAKSCEIYGTVRCMTAGGLERKCDPDAYVANVDDLVAAVT